MGHGSAAWLHDAATGRRFALQGTDVAVIGREAPHEVRLADDLFVSRRHAQIVLVDGEYWLSDLASANGSFLNRRRVTDACRLVVGDVIQVGNTSLRFSADAPQRPFGSCGCGEQAGGAA